MNGAFIDTNVTTGAWPFRRFPGDTPSDLVARLKLRGVTQAWTGSFEGVFHRDLSAANARLARICEATGAGLLIPFGTVNPCAPGWREDLRRCHELHRMPGIRLHPNYHGYALDHPEVLPLFREARARKLIVQIAIQLEDERTQHPLMRVAPVDPAPLASLAAQAPDLRMVILNRNRLPAGDGLKRLVAAARVHFDISMIEGAGCVGALVETAGVDRVVFGSHAPFQYIESALLKLKESDIAGDDEMAIVNGNAARLLTP